MYLVCGIVLAVLLIITLMLFSEERRIRKNITHGLASKFWQLRESRQFVRFNDEIKIRYNPLSSHDSLRYSKTSNISKKGLCLLTYEKLKEKKSLELEMDVPGFPKPLTLIGQVMWTKDLKTRDARGRRLFYTGIKFNKIKPEYEAILLTHLNKLKRICLEK
ncbi:MAG: PilZ domain-containing protein [Candidatus Omnitrophica bacterium]|nr:PilZ domain-containing protein [Candidatus Omnitrophota bacterium]